MYKLYGMAASLQSDLKEKIKRSVSYVGKRTTLATFKLVVDGVPAKELMNDAQQLYFETFTKDFVTKFITETIFVVDIQDQALREGSMLSSSIEVTGELRGSKEHDTPDKAFAENVKNALKNGASAFVQGLTFSVLLPSGQLAADDASYFRGIIGMEAEIEPVIQVTQPPKSAPTGTTAPVAIGASDAAGAVNAIIGKTIDGATADGDNHTLILIGAIGAVLVVMLGLILCLCCCRSKRRSRSEGDSRSGAGKDYAATMESRDVECAPPSPKKISKHTEPDKSLSITAEDEDSVKISDGKLSATKSGGGSKVEPRSNVPPGRARSSDGLPPRMLPPPPASPRDAQSSESLMPLQVRVRTKSTDDIDSRMLSQPSPRRTCSEESQGRAPLRLHLPPSPNSSSRQPQRRDGAPVPASSESPVRGVRRSISLSQNGSQTKQLPPLAKPGLPRRTHSDENLAAFTQQQPSQAAPGTPQRDQPPMTPRKIVSMGAPRRTVGLQVKPIEHTPPLAPTLGSPRHAPKTQPVRPQTPNGPPKRTQSMGVMKPQPTIQATHTPSLAPPVGSPRRAPQAMRNLGQASIGQPVRPQTPNGSPKRTHSVGAMKLQPTLQATQGATA